MTNTPLKFLFAGGGTGGHLFSGISVAQELVSRFPQSKTLFVGTDYGLEKEIIPASGFSLKFIQATPLKGSGWKARLESLLRLPRAYFQSKKILKDFNPDVVIGIGGYASGPMTLAAHFSKIPTAIIEQNSIPGFTNRQLGRFVDKIFVAFEKAKDFFPKGKTFLTGNPTRQMKEVPTENLSKDKFFVFILGGSQGAHSLNMRVVESLPFLKNQKNRFFFIHQTGVQDFEAVKSAYEKNSVAAEAFPFSQNLNSYYSKTDLMLCRAGAGTITELQNLGLPSILIPYPFAADDHQLYNANEMEVHGAAEIILDQELTGEKIAHRLQFFVNNPSALETMRQNALKLAKPQAAQSVLDHCLAMAQARSILKTIKKAASSKTNGL